MACQSRVAGSRGAAWEKKTVLLLESAVMEIRMTGQPGYGIRKICPLLGSLAKSPFLKGSPVLGFLLISIRLWGG